MKYLAHTSPDVNSSIVSIYDVMADGLVSGESYYSLWDLIPMSAKVGYKRRKPHFAYKGGYGAMGKGESVEHSITKYVIYRSRMLHLKYDGGVAELRFDDVRIEHRFNDGQYVADIYARLASDSDVGLRRGDWLVVEICKTHRVDKAKQQFFERNGIAAIEIKYWDAISFERDEAFLQRRIEGWLSKPQYFRWLYNPSAASYSGGTVGGDAVGADVTSTAPTLRPIVVTPLSANARPRRTLFERLRRLF